MNKRFVILSIIILLATFFIGRQIGVNQERKTQKSKVLGASKKVFKLSLNNWVGYGPFWLAKDKGFFEEEGVEAQFTVVEDQAQRKMALLSHNVDALADTVDMLVLAKSQDIPAVAVMELDISNGADGIVATENINSINDLKGKKIAVQKNFVSESFLFYLLKQNGLSTKDVQIIDMEAGSAGAAFIAGRIDAAVTYEPWMSKAKDRKGAKILASSKEVNGIIVDILTVHEDCLKQNPDVVKKVVKAWFKAVNFWQKNPDQANMIMAKHYNVNPQEFAELIKGLSWPSLEDNISYFGTKEKPGKIYEVANIFSDIFLETGQISKKTEINSAINNDLIISLYENGSEPDQKK